MSAFSESSTTSSSASEDEQEQIQQNHLDDDDVEDNVRSVQDNMNQNAGFMPESDEKKLDNNAGGRESLDESLDENTPRMAVATALSSDEGSESEDENINNAENWKRKKSSSSLSNEVETKIESKKKKSIKESSMINSKNTNANNKKAKITNNSNKSSRKKGLASSNATNSKKSAAKSLTLPFRAIKRIMKIDKDIATVQNESAILTSYAAELFVTKLAQESHTRARNRSRNTVRYEDVAEARASNPSMSFLEPLIP